ncbi:cytoplasmic polyadenylation element binding protein 3 [Loa loa]|uniref:Cytoplasmic polyadenylation element-binding protein 3 n=1 Tax=Loa loa TaxID=7209 RepID=A0A1S0TWP5_LOALO|nr:cytoplasmic polyadenylation element binding protein 3 [Loa loa]EFO20716.1 cytoplasmic polyadenylation element binding protein 3 [Loa loa]
MDKLQIKNQNKVKLSEEKPTTSKTPVAIAPEILTSKKDGSEVISLSLTDQNHNNKPGTNYNNRTNGKPSGIGIDIRKKHAGDYQATNDGATKPLDSMIVDTQPIQKSWQTVMTGAKEYQQYHHQVMAHMLQNGYSPTYVQIIAFKMMTASVVRSQVTEASTDFEMRRGKPCYWKGELPPRNYCNPVFSSKVFIGGVPWDITEPALLDSFSKYGSCRVEWPSKESRHARINPRRAKITGYVYMIFENDLAVKKLLQDCSQEFGTAGEWYFKLTARRASGLEIRQVQVIPWVITDASYILNPNIPLEPKKTVFVGALHGMITAQVLFSIMRDVYGDVLFVGIDTDRQKYPIGSARVTFSTQSAYFRAIESGYLEIHTSKFTKKVQIDPFLEDAKCSQCECVQGPYFCREKSCFKYFCLQCWEVRHALTGPYGGHKPMIRTHRRSVQSESYISYSAANCTVSYDPRTVVSRQYFGTVTSEIGIQMNIRPPIPEHITKIAKPPSVNLTFRQPTYLLPTYPNQPLKQVQVGTPANQPPIVWVPPTNQPPISSYESRLKARTLNSFRCVPCIVSNSSGTRNGHDHSDSSLRMENIADGTLSAASMSSSSPSVETVSANAL